MKFERFVAAVARGTFALSASIIGACTAFPAIKSATPPRSVSTQVFSPMLFRNVAIYVDDRTHDVPDEQGTLRTVEDAFLASALDRGYVVAARSDAAKIMYEAGLQDRGILEGDIASRARLHGVSAVLLVTIDRTAMNTYRPARRVAGGWLTAETTKHQYKYEATISARLIDAEMGEIAWLSRFDADTLVDERYAIAPSLRRFARAVAQDLPAATSTQAFNAQTRYLASSWPGVRRIGVYVDDRTRSISNSEGIRRSIETEFITAALRRGLIVAARADIPELTRELRLQSQSPHMDEIFARMGRMLNVDAMLVVSANQLNAEHYRESAVAPDQVRIDATIGARLVGTNGIAIWTRDRSETGFGFDRSDATSFLVSLARSLAELIPGATVPTNSAIPVSSPSSTRAKLPAFLNSPCGPRELTSDIPGVASARNWRDSLRLQLLPLVSSNAHLNPLEVKSDAINASLGSDLLIVPTRIVNGQTKPATGVAGMVVRKHQNRTFDLGEKVYITALSVKERSIEASLASQTPRSGVVNGEPVKSPYKGLIQWDFEPGQLHFMSRPELFMILNATLSFEKCS